MISYDMDPFYHTLWDTKTGEKPFDVRTLTLRSFLSMVRDIVSPPLRFGHDQKMLKGVSEG